MTDATVHVGDCRDVMAAMDAESVDAIVTDPPYGLAFMGKGWDHAVPGVAFWTEALRVAKPGAHLVAFGGTRTFHRLACAIEDAGWEIRDCLSWLYGSGFPKSLDVGKAIDRMDAAEEQAARRYRFTAWVRSTGVTAAQIDAATGTNMGGHYTTHPTQPAIMTRKHLEACRRLLGDVPAWVEAECDRRTVESRNMAAREVLDTETRYNEPSGIVRAGRDERRLIERKITAPATDAAKQWDGWGTALKPAWEPIILARKPLAGTVAANVTQHGTGALNVDGCRIGSGGQLRWGTAPGMGYHGANKAETLLPTANPVGRWPANVVLDEAAAALLNAQTGADTSRFFYCAKASRSERNAGAVANAHPTVKPIALMRWLVRLVTPPGGLVLDPFTGSGTTGGAAVLEGMRFVGAEREAEYAAIAERRIAHWAGQATPAEPDLFACA